MEARATNPATSLIGTWYLSVSKKRPQGMYFFPCPSSQSSLQQSIISAAPSSSLIIFSTFISIHTFNPHLCKRLHPSSPPTPSPIIFTNAFITHLKTSRLSYSGTVSKNTVQVSHSLRCHTQTYTSLLQYSISKFFYHGLSNYFILLHYTITDSPMSSTSVYQLSTSVYQHRTNSLSAIKAYWP